MGLDQYLERRHYVKRWTHIRAEHQFLVTVTRGGQPYPGIDPERVSYVTEQVAYWRKANAIHRWFVENVQNGKDDCRSYYVESEQLRELLKLVDAVLANEIEAEKSLPTQSGFFFGVTEYGENYLEDLRDTKRQLEPLLAEDSDVEYYYQSSW